jgi:hypothetical protein
MSYQRSGARTSDHAVCAALKAQSLLSPNALTRFGVVLLGHHPQDLPLLSPSSGASSAAKRAQGGTPMPLALTRPSSRSPTYRPLSDTALFASDSCWSNQSRQRSSLSGAARQRRSVVGMEGAGCASPVEGGCVCVCVWGGGGVAHSRGSERDGWLEHTWWDDIRWC